MPAPTIPNIATQNIIINTEATISVTIANTPTTVEVTGDLEGVGYKFHPSRNTNNLVIDVNIDRFLTDKSLTIAASNADGSATPVTFTYNIVSAAPMITRPTGRIKWVKGKDHNLLIPVSNTPINLDSDGLQIYLRAVLEDLGIRISGRIPADANFTVSSGLLDFSVSNFGGTDTENDVPFDILETAPQLSVFSYTSGNRRISWTKVANARSYAYQVGDADWKDIGDVSNYTLSSGEAPAIGETVNLRVNQPWIGTAVSMVYRTTPGTPQNLTISNTQKVGSDWQTTLNWDAPSNNGGGSLTYYLQYREYDNNYDGGWTIAGNTTSTTFTHNVPYTPSRNIYYRVRTWNGGFFSAYVISPIRNMG